MADEDVMNNFDKKKGSPESESEKFQKEYKSAIFSAYRDFYKLTPAEQAKHSVNKSLTWKEKFREQFWNYLKNKLWNKVLENIDKNLFNIYFETLSKKKFTLSELTKWNWKEDLKTEVWEEQAIHNTLEKFEEYCGTIDSDVYRDFSRFANFDHKKHKINAGTKFKTIDQIYQVWDDFLASSRAPKIWDVSKDKARMVLEWVADSYDYTERMMVSVLITKISQILSASDLADFKAQFVLPITALSSIQTLNGFANAWDSFLQWHNLDADTAKELNSVIVTNADVRKLMIDSGIATSAGTDWNFSKWDLRFKTIFGKLVTAQYLKEFDETNSLIDEKLKYIHNTFADFPPYMNEILKIYPYEVKDLQVGSSEIINLQTEINNILKKINSEKLSEDEKIKLKTELKNHQENLDWLLWSRYVESIEKTNKPVSDILKKLNQNNFNLSLLTKGEQQILLNLLVENKLDESVQNQIPELFGTYWDDFKEFVKDLFDLDKNKVVMPTQDGPIELEFEKKEFVGGPMKKLPSLENLANASNFPMNFVIKNTPDSEAFFGAEYWEHMFFDFNGTKIHESYKVHLKNKDWNVVGPWYISTYGKNGEYNFYTQPLNYPAQERELVRDVDGNSIVLNDETVWDYEIVVENKNIHLNWKAIGQLLFGFMLGSASIPMVESIQNNKELNDKLKNLETYKDIEENYPEWEKEWEKVWSKITASSDEKELADSFSKKWESMLWDWEFQEGSRILVNIGISELPPRHAPGNERAWMEVDKINSRDNTFTIKLYWAHLGMGPDFEWKKITLPMTKTTLENREKAWWRSSVTRIPPLDKNNNTFEDQLSIVKKSSPKLRNLKVFDNELNYSNGKFKFKYPKDDPTKKWEVTYFSSRKTTLPHDSVWDPSTEVIYKISHNSDKTYTVSTEFLDDDKEDRKKKKKFKYKRKMDYTSFILFVADRNLFPETEESIKPKKEKSEELNNGNIHKKIKWFSIGNVIKTVKDSVDKVKDQIAKKQQEDADDMMDIVFSQHGLYEKIGNMLPFPGIKESFTKMHYEVRKERDDRVWNKIKYWSDLFSEDEDFSLLSERYLEKRLSWEKQRLNRYQAAGAYLAFIKKGGMYSRHFAKHWVGKWNRVKMLLGERHWERFKKIQDVKKKTLEEQNNQHWMYAEGTMDELVDLEVRYIASVIDGRELGPWGPEELQQAAYWSRQYADEIQNAYDEHKSTSKVNEKYENLWNMWFDHAIYEFRRYITSGRPYKALPFYKKMGDAVRSSQDKQLLNMATTFLILSGYANNFMDVESRKLIQQTCRSTWFYPGILARDSRNQEYFSVLLKYATWNEFPDSLQHNLAPFGQKKKFVPYNIQNFSLGQMNNADGLFNELKKWWLEGNGDKIDKFLDLSNSNFIDKLNDPDLDEHDRGVLQLILGKSMEADYETVNANVKGNFFISTDNPLNFSAAFTTKMMNISGKDFAGEDWEVESQVEYWSAHAEAIPTYEMWNNKARLSFLIDKFFNSFGTIFDQTKRRDLLRAIKTCQNMIENNVPHAKEKINYIFRYLIDGQVVAHYGGIPDALADTIRAYRNLFMENYQNIDESVILKVSENWWSEEYITAYNDPYNFVNMKVYSAKVWRTWSNLWVSVEREDLRDPSKNLNPVIDTIASSLKSANESVAIESDKTLWDEEFNQFMKDNNLDDKTNSNSEIISKDFSEQKKDEDGAVRLTKVLKSDEKLSEEKIKKKTKIFNLFGKDKSWD